MLLRLDSNKTLNVILVYYAPSAASDDDEVEESYDELKFSHRQIHSYGLDGLLQC